MPLRHCKSESEAASPQKLAQRPNMRERLTSLLIGPILSLAISCGSQPSEQRVQATYDQKSGKLSQLTVDAKKDGKPNIFSYMDGTKFLRVEIDNNEDGMIDRWEYYGADQKLEKVGFSRVNDGKADTWAYEHPDGTIAKVEVSTRRDGKVNRTEFYAKDVLLRAEEDTNQDGRVDKWETYLGGGLSSVAFDTKGTGAPNQVIDYQKEASTRPAPRQ